MNKKEYFNYRLNNLNERFNNRILEVASYLSKFTIDNIVFGYSGGRDSTFVLLILTLIKQQYLPNLNIYPVTIEYQKNYKFDTFQLKDVKFIKKQNNSYLDFSQWVYIKSKRKDLNSLKNIIHSKNKSLEELAHQSNYQYMYHLLFTLAQANNAITVGTTNLDEIAYIGWFGKNSDMCVDLQFITDFHKFEINQILKEYNIDIADVPKGDLYSGSSDEEIFETSYEDLAYFSYCKCNNIPVPFNCALEVLHRKNLHKYMGQTFNPYFIKDNNYYFIYKEYN